MAIIKVSLAWAWPETSGEAGISVNDGATIGEVLIQAGLSGAAILPRVVAKGAAGFGVWGRVRPKTHVLRDGDRIEIYRQLTADPKEARRTRAQKGK